MLRRLWRLKVVSTRAHDDAVPIPVSARISRGGPRESRSPIESRRVRAVAYFNKKEH